MNHLGDTNKMISDTPRTESFNCYDSGCDDPLHAWGAFSAELERELNAANERIKQLESWMESLETLEQHSGILPEREWFGSEIGYLRKGEAFYKGEAKP